MPIVGWKSNSPFAQAKGELLYTERLALENSEAFEIMPAWDF